MSALCHPILRAINGGRCPVCELSKTSKPENGNVIPFEDLSSYVRPLPGAVEQLDWRAHAPSVLTPIIARLPQMEQSGTFKDRASIYKGPPVGMKPAVRYVAQEAQRQLEEREVVAERCRRSLAYFVRAYWPIFAPGIPLYWNWHLEEICKHVQMLLEDWIKRQHDPGDPVTGEGGHRMKLQNLAINCPPRSLKSTIVSVCAPAWMWLRWPSWTSIFVSANPKVAVRDARACRACLESNWYVDIKATLAAQYPEGSDERKALEWELVGSGDLHYENTAKGVRDAMSFKSMITGLGADAIFIDDPNDVKKVMSERERANVNDIWDLALCNRVQSFTNSVRIMIMQRCHELDLTGHWQASMPIARTFYLAIPLEFDPELDAVNRKSPYGYHDPRAAEGDILHPVRFPPEVVEGERTRLGEYGFAGQMNQKPAPVEGGCFKRTAWNFFYIASSESFHHPLTGSIVDRDEVKDSALAWQPIDPSRRARVRPKGCDTTRPAIPLPFLDRLVISADTSFGSEKETASRVALGVFGIKGKDKFIIENRTKVRSVDDTIEAIRQLVKDFPAVSVVLVERKASGDYVCKVLKSEISGIIPIDDNSNWMDRANGMLPSFLAGNWYILEGAQWATSIVSEHAAFPNGAHDDQIDMCSQLSKHEFGESGNGGTLSVGW